MNKNRVFLFKLASHLNMTVNELENTMTYKEFLEWQQYHHIEPFAVDRIELMLSEYMSMFVSVNSKEKLEPIDFMKSITEEQKQEIKNTRKNNKLLNFMRARVNHGI